MSELESARERMIARHIGDRGIRTPAVLAAMLAVPREEFVPETARRAAYDDRPLPIGSGQTISQPFIVALMIEAAGLTPTSRVLDVGTGSGYAAAVAAEIAADVVSIERVPELAAAAAERLERLGYGNIRVVVGDGTLGFPDAAPFDAIVAAAAGPIVPTAWLEQLAPGGRIVMPLAQRRGQELVLITRRPDGTLAERRLEGVVFVPLIGEQGWPEQGGPERG